MNKVRRALYRNEFPNHTGWLHHIAFTFERKELKNLQLVRTAGKWTIKLKRKRDLNGAEKW